MQRRFNYGPTLVGTRLFGSAIVKGIAATARLHWMKRGGGVLRLMSPFTRGSRFARAAGDDSLAIREWQREG